MINWIKKYFTIEYSKLTHSLCFYNTQDLLRILETKNLTPSDGNRIVLELLKRALKDK